jgi:hypothetical protein
MKRTFIILAAMAAALSFLGCDAILSTLYPEFKDGGSAKGGVDVSLSIDNDLGQFMQPGVSQPGTFNDGAIPVKIALVPFKQFSDHYGADWGNTQVVDIYKNDLHFDSGSGKNIADAHFPVKSNATTKVVAWLDVDKTGKSAIDFQKPRPGTIVYAQNGDFFLDLRYYNPSQSTIKVGGNLSSTSTINWDQLRADPNAGPATGLYPPSVSISCNNLNPAANVSVSFYSQGDDSRNNGWIVAWEWSIFDQYSNLIFMPSGNQQGPTFAFSFPNPGSYTVKLRVQNNSGKWSTDIDPSTGISAPPEQVLVNVHSPVDDQPPTSSFEASPATVANNGTLYLYNYSYDYDAGNNYVGQSSLTSTWTIKDSSTIVRVGPWVDDSYPVAVNLISYGLAAGSYQVILDVSTKSGLFQTASSSQWITIVNPGTEGSGSLYDPFVSSPGYQSYGNPGSYLYYSYSNDGNPVTIDLSGASLYQDLYVVLYGDSGYKNVLEERYIQAGTVGSLSGAAGYPHVWIAVYSYSGGWYTLD